MPIRELGWAEPKPKLLTLVGTAAFFAAVAAVAAYFVVLSPSWFFAILFALYAIGNAAICLVVAREAVKTRRDEHEEFTSAITRGWHSFPESRFSRADDEAQVGGTWAASSTAPFDSLTGASSGTARDEPELAPFLRQEP